MISYLSLSFPYPGFAIAILVLIATLRLSLEIVGRIKRNEEAAEDD